MELDIYHYTNLGGCNEKHDVASLTWDGSHGLFSLADGFGASQDNGLASKLVVDAISSDWNNAIESGDFSPIQWLPAELLMVNQAFITAKEQTPPYEHMKSTLVSLAISLGQVTWAHIGDARLYYIHNGQLQAVTADHSVAFKKYLSGEILRDQINTDEDRSCLLSAMGESSRFTPQCVTLDAPLSSGDGFLLCSDGFWAHVLDTELLIEYCAAQSATQWVEALLLRALPRLSATCDNLSAIAILVQ